MSGPPAAPALRFQVPVSWRAADPHEVVWEANLPRGRHVGLLAPALSLAVTIGEETVRAGATVILMQPRGATDAAIAERAEELEGCVPDAAAWIDLPVGRAFRTQVFSSGPRTKVGAPGRHASVRYLIPKDDWLVVLTFDTPSPRWAIPLVEAFDEIAIRATWAH